MFTDFVKHMALINFIDNVYLPLSTILEKNHIDIRHFFTLLLMYVCVCVCVSMYVEYVYMYSFYLQNLADVIIRT